MVRTLVSVHRWLGIALCLLFALWFASGAVLMFVPFPALDTAERLERAEAVDLSRIRVAPLAAIVAAAEDIHRLRIVAAAGRPVYALSGARSMIAIDAETGAKIDGFPADDAGRIAAGFAGRPIGSVSGPFDYDQWIVHQQFDSYRPLYRVAVGDEDGTELYVSSRSGEVVQRTTRRARLWNYAGAVVHWIYPTLLRRSWAAWDVTVWTLALAGTVMAVAGSTLGIIRSAGALRRPGRRALTAFRGWMRWHHLIGLAAGLFLIGWIFSGWLSMDHGRLFSTGRPDPESVARFHGLTLEAAAALVSVDRIAGLGPVQELDVVALNGDAWLVAHRPDRSVTIVRAKDGSGLRVFADDVLLAAARRAWPDAPLHGIGPIPDDDLYGRLLNEPLPATVRRIVIDRSPQVWIHVDAATGELVGVMDRSRRIYRWLFNGLHDFDVPGLSTNAPLRVTVMLPLLALGFLLSITGAVIGIRRLFSP